MIDNISINLEVINNNIARALERSNRSADEITLVGVTKTIDVERIQTLVNNNVTNIGENKVQELLEKCDTINNAKWHMIGHLQRNKVKSIIDKVVLIHSIDSFKLAQEVSKRALQVNRKIDILIEINIANEETKHGIKYEDAERFAVEISSLEGINVSGLMCVAPFVENSEQNRAYFKKMYELFIDIKSNMHNNINMQHLSMGMTNDYEVAIQEGSTIIRIGTGIFGDRL